MSPRGIVLGIAIGVALAVSLESYPIGVAIGFTLALAFSQEGDSKVESEV